MVETSPVARGVLEEPGAVGDQSRGVLASSFGLHAPGLLSELG